MASKSKKKDDEKIFVTKIERSILPVVLVGETPLIINRLSNKVRIQLLIPPPRMNAAAKNANLKHDPVAEFRASVHTIADTTQPTLLAMPAAAAKKAMASAALDMPGMKKAQIGRLAFVQGEYVGVYGLPKLFIAPVRNSDIGHTPDMRTRCIVPEWVIKLNVQFVEPMLNRTIIVNLLNAAGMYIGIGDWRNEKGSGTYGQFKVLSTVQAQKDTKVQEILLQGRLVQEEAMLNPATYDDETAWLMEHYLEEIERLGKKKMLAGAEAEEEQLDETQAIDATDISDRMSRA